MAVARWIALACLVGVAAADPAAAATAKRSVFGHMPDGTAVDAVTLTGANGVSARIVAYGATLQAFDLPDRHGHVADVTLGYDDLKSSLEHPNFWGQTVGRYANRIAGGRFTLDGHTYQLPINDRTNSLHGGVRGFDKQLWRIASVKDGPTASVALTLRSPDGDQGYPGNLDVTVTYSLDDHGALTIDYAATTDRPTIINLTNHAIYNLAGEGAPDGLAGQRLTIAAHRFTPVDKRLIPTGELKPVAGTVFDFTHGRELGDGIRDGHDPQIVIAHGWDHNFVLDKGTTATPGFAARLEDPASGRVLELSTTAPGVQVYTGNFLDATLIGKNGHLYRQGDGVALEPQVFPDTPNQPKFGSARLDPGQTYHHRVILRASVAR